MSRQQSRGANGRLVWFTDEAIAYFEVIRQHIGADSVPEAILVAGALLEWVLKEARHLDMDNVAVISGNEVSAIKIQNVLDLTKHE